MRSFISLLLAILLFGCSEEHSIVKNAGAVFGTTYGVIYFSETDHQESFIDIFEQINQSLSTYLPDSDISRINRGEQLAVDRHFIRVFNTSRRIFEETGGVFDPTIGAVVNAWDFGPEGQIEALDSLKIKKLMSSVGLNKVQLKDDMIIKPDSTYLDFNAIAKGYAVDVIGEFLESKGVMNYLVEIGGEIRSRGMNKERNSTWLVGIDRPNFDGSQSIFSKVSLGEGSMATSGTYRKFKTDSSGNRYAHIIDTRSGYPSRTNILSVSVLAENCMAADAYATALQAMGIEKARQFLSDKPELSALMIIENEVGELETININRFPED